MSCLFEGFFFQLEAHRHPVTPQTGGAAWTRKGGLCVPMIENTLRDSSEVLQEETMAFGSLKKEDAAQQLNQVMPINRQPVQMQTGGKHWTGE